ncbi:hypothetical protein V6B16_05155 [Salinimicrobium catena]|uniref:hypothetical protein n=1 Tax=Salinimicrobium catena TaxID=390640 RepID=UPI002FE492FE
MKNFRRVLLLLIFCSTSTIAQELNTESEFLKQKRPTVFNSIKEFSENKWKDDYSMVLHEVNKQSKGFVDILKFMDEDESNDRILQNAISKWSDGSNIPIDQNPTIDWGMVSYEVRKQQQSRAALTTSKVNKKGSYQLDEKGFQELKNLEKDGYSSGAAVIKVSQPEFFNAIRNFAINKHQNPELIIEEVNLQIDAFTKVADLAKRYSMRGTKVFNEALENNSNGGTTDNFTSNSTIDWVAIYKEMKNTLEPPRPILKERKQ